MMNWTRSGIALAAATLLSANAWAGEGPAGHSHSQARRNVFGRRAGQSEEAGQDRPGDDGRSGRQNAVRPGAA